MPHDLDDEKAQLQEADIDRLLAPFVTSDALANQPPIEALPAKMRLGTLLRRGRMAKQMSLREGAKALDVPMVMLGEMERGILPTNAIQIEAAAHQYGISHALLLTAARDWHAAAWKPEDRDGPGVTLESMTGGVRMPVDPSQIVMPAEQQYVEYREGWIAGASGRPNPDDMSAQWHVGWQDGRTTYTESMLRRQLELGISDDNGSVPE